MVFFNATWTGLMCEYDRDLQYVVMNMNSGLHDSTDSDIGNIVTAYFQYFDSFFTLKMVYFIL